MADLGAIAILVDAAPLQIGKWVSGTVLDSAGSPARRELVVVSRSNRLTGAVEVVARGYSRPDSGAFALGCGFETDVAVVAFDDAGGANYNALVIDKVTPV